MSPSYSGSLTPSPLQRICDPFMEKIFSEIVQMVEKVFETK